MNNVKLVYLFISAVMIMDQVVFVFDLDQVVPLHEVGGKHDAALQEDQLNCVNLAVLRIATYCTKAGWISESRKDLPCFGFRFYSSSGCFYISPQLTPDWYDLSLDSWGLLEKSLSQRINTALDVQRTKESDDTVGLLSQAAAMCKALEDVCTQYSWDRPVLHSPVKKGSDRPMNLVNSVVVVSKLPGDWADMCQYIGVDSVRRKPTVIEVIGSLTNKKVKEILCGEPKVGLHILDIRHGGGEERWEVLQLFNRALKETIGGVLTISSLCTPHDTINKRGIECSTLLCSSISIQLVPSSIVVRSHLAEVGLAIKGVTENYVQEEFFNGKQTVGFEFVKCGVDLSGMQTRGFTRSDLFQPGQKWSNTVTIWSDNSSSSFGAIFLFLQSTGQCLILENKLNIMGVLFYQSETSGTFCILDKVESHFYNSLLGLETNIHDPINLSGEVQSFISNIETQQFSQKSNITFSTKATSTQFDVSVFEHWRLPDVPTTQFMTSLKVTNSLNSSPSSSYSKQMMMVREVYTSNSCNKEDSSLLSLVGDGPVADKRLEVKNQPSLTNKTTVELSSREESELDNEECDDERNFGPQLMNRSSTVNLPEDIPSQSVEVKESSISPDLSMCEFAGHSSDSSNQDEFEFAGDSSDEQDEIGLNTGVLIPESEANFFAGKSDESYNSDLYEPTKSIDLGDPYNFDSSDDKNVGQFKHLHKKRNDENLDDLDFCDPLQLTKPEVQFCSRFCKNNCRKLNTCVSFICEMHSIRAKYSTLNRQERRNLILDQLSHQHSFGLPIDVFFVKSEPLCIKFFSEVSGVSLRVLSSVVEDFQNGVHHYTHALENSKKLSAQMMHFISWMVSFAKIHGEHKPDDNGVIALPSFLTKAKLYQYYSDNVGSKRLALSTFYQALGVKFGRQRDDVTLPCIVIPKDSTHCKCNECLSLKKFKRSAKTELQISVADKLLQNHLNVCARERMQVWSLFQRCVDFAHENLGIQFDDMDQTKTNIPKFSERSKSLQNFNQLKTHCTGVIVHSGLYPENRSVIFYLNNDQFEQGGSKSVSIIQEVLKKHVEVHGFLPPYLHIRNLAYNVEMYSNGTHFVPKSLKG